ncbi:MAG: IS21 family transposase [Planctomycetes bacterium]|nr:IS21 family transposase [Planctomycetota bacterium]
MKRHAVQVLRKAGMSVDEIARVTQTSGRTVQRVSKEAPVQVTAVPIDRSMRSVGRPSKVQPFASIVQEIFKDERDRDLPSVEILRRVRLKGYTGGKSALYELISQVRPEKTEPPVVRFEGVAGEFSQYDFGQVLVKYDIGEKERIHFFASRLKWSRWNHVALVPNEKLETLVRAFLSGLESFGGVPLVCVFDNPKTIALKHEGPLIEWNPSFIQVPLDFRFAAELCTPGRGQEKGAVENLVKWVKGSFFKVRRFHDREDLERQLVEWHREVNVDRPSRATKVPPAARIEQERRRLRPLAWAPADYPIRVPITVGVTAMVEHEGIRYSMPAKSIGIPRMGTRIEPCAESGDNAASAVHRVRWLRGRALVKRGPLRRRRRTHESNEASGGGAFRVSGSHAPGDRSGTDGISSSKIYDRRPRCLRLRLHG